MKKSKSNDQKEKIDYFKIGKIFEKYVLDLFPDEYFSVMHITADPQQIGRYVENCTDPDLKFKSRDNDEEFWVECKFRSTYDSNGCLKWAETQQLRRYMKIQKDTDTEIFIVLGVGGAPYAPENIHLFSLKKLPYIKIFKSKLDICEISDRRYFKTIKQLHQLNDLLDESD